MKLSLLNHCLLDQKFILEGNATILVSDCSFNQWPEICEYVNNSVDSRFTLILDYDCTCLGDRNTILDWSKVERVIVEKIVQLELLPAGIPTVFMLSDYYEADLLELDGRFVGACIRSYAHYANRLPVIRYTMALKKEVHLYGFSYLNEPFDLEKKFGKGTITSAYTSLPLVYGNRGIALHPNSASYDIALQEDTFESVYGNFPGITLWNLRCMAAWARGIRLPIPGWL